MLEDTRKRLAENMTFTITARLAMVACAGMLPIALSIGGWYGQRIVDAGDKALAAIVRLEKKQELLEQSLTLQLEAAGHDREQLRAGLTRQDDRIRLLELGSASLDRQRGRDR